MINKIIIYIKERDECRCPFLSVMLHLEIYRVFVLIDRFISNLGVIKRMISSRDDSFNAFFMNKHRHLRHNGNPRYIAIRVSFAAVGYTICLFETVMCTTLDIYVFLLLLSRYFCS